MILVSLTVVVSVGPGVDALAAAGDAVVFDRDPGGSGHHLDALGGDEAGEGEVGAGQVGSFDRGAGRVFGPHGDPGRPRAGVEAELAVVAVGRQMTAWGAAFATAPCTSSRLAKLREQGAVAGRPEESTAAGALEPPPQPTAVKRTGQGGDSAQRKESWLGQAEAKAHE